MARLLLVVAAALMLASAAGAATIDDLRGLGYSVQISNPGTAPDCPTYYISGYGIGTYFSGCDQAAIDNLAAPAPHCNRVWQYSHQDQYAAFQSLSTKGYAIGGDQCADIYTVTNPKTGETIYSGSGSGLPGVDASNGPAPDPPAGVAAPTGASDAPSNCLPLCPPAVAPGGVPVPARAPVAPALAAATTVAVDAPPATVVDTSSYTVVAASAEETATTGVIGWLNTPYMTTPLVAPTP